MAEYLVVPENAHVEPASLVEVVRLHDEIRDIADRRGVAAVNGMIPETVGIKRKSARIGSTLLKRTPPIVYREWTPVATWG